MSWRGVIDCLVEHRLERNESGPMRFRNALGGCAVGIELGKPFVVYRAATQHKGFANDQVHFGQRFAGSLEQSVIIAFVDFYRAFVFSIELVTPMRMLNNVGLRSRQSACQRSAS